jgi:nitroimidazol reductase NimA-like FMN-containing flavoprotein (pyridoxamine 5'-phosphate oxidase superfamily)
VLYYYKEAEFKTKYFNERLEMLKKMKDIVRSNDLCVLATVSEGKPHCSLMSYVSDEEGQEVFMVSNSGTRKYLNLMQNPNVSLLIDTREEKAGQQRGDIKALTATGAFHPIDDQSKKDSVRTRFLNQHPHLADILNAPGAEIFSIRIKTFQLLNGVKDIFIETV